LLYARQPSVQDRSSTGITIKLYNDQRCTNQETSQEKTGINAKSNRENTNQ